MRYLIILFCSFSFVICSAQTLEKDLYTIKTEDKRTIIGQLKKITEDSIIVDSKSLGIIRLSRDQVLSFRTGIPSTIFTNISEPYFVHTGIPNGKGNHFYRNYAFFGHYASFGLDDHFDLSIGFEALSFILNSSFDLPVVHVGAKYSGSVGDGLSLGLSGKGYFNNNGSIIFVNLPLTFGGENSNITISPGISITDGETYFFPFYNFNFALSKKLRLVAEGLYVDRVLIGTILLELKTLKNYKIHLGIGHFQASFAVPNIALTVPFGGAKK